MTDQNLITIDSDGVLSKKRKKWNAKIIIEKSREMFYEKGFDLSMRDIARELNTRASSLYRHIDNKRELWFAITTADFNEFSNRMRVIAENHQGSSLELLKKTGLYFLEFAREDFNRFNLIFLFEPPKITDQEKGQYELACNPDSISFLVFLCGKVIQEENLVNISAEELAIHVWSQVLGYSVIKSPINAYLFEKEEFKHLSSQKYDIVFLDQFIDFILAYKKKSKKEE
ncbi:MAG: TetR/AcrR family transcriptional regulator [Candidatus Hodarchaeales archaeon]|jgi:hypothetical protein